jgi:hypothetical protein
MRPPSGPPQTWACVVGLQAVVRHSRPPAFLAAGRPVHPPAIESALSLGSLTGICAERDMGKLVGGGEGKGEGGQDKIVNSLTVTVIRYQLSLLVSDDKVGTTA